MFKSFTSSFSKKGGKSSTQIESLKDDIIRVQDELKTILSKLEDVELSEKSKEDSNFDSKEDSEKSIIETQDQDSNNNDTDSDSDSDNEDSVKEIKKEDINDQTISIDGFDGTVKNLKSTMKSKIKQLSKTPRYKDKADKFSKILTEVDESGTVDEIKDVLKKSYSATFKNNKLMGGKKTISRKKKSSNRSLKRH
jgi:Na+/phosphate symporter